MTEIFMRDALMTAAILGLFAFAWFGWAQQDPPRKKRWPIMLGIGSGVSLIVSIIGGIFAWRNWGTPSMISGDAFGSYTWVFIVEFTLIALATLILLVARKMYYIPTAVSFIVGVHFVWLAPMFGDVGLYVLAGLMTVSSLAPLFLSKKLGISLGTLTCTCVALVLFGFALRGLLLAFL